MPFVNIRFIEGIMIIQYAPGLLLGFVFGAFAWRTHRVFGAVLGALVSVALSAEFWNIYENTALSVSMDPARGNCRGAGGAGVARPRARRRPPRAPGSGAADRCSAACVVRSWASRCVARRMGIFQRSVIALRS